MSLIIAYLLIGLVQLIGSLLERDGFFDQFDSNLEVVWAFTAVIVCYIAVWPYAIWYERRYWS